MLDITGYDGVAIDAGQSVTLTAEESGLENVKAVAYLWSTGSTTKSITYTATDVGTNEISCTATITFEDDSTASETAIEDIEVKDLMAISGYTAEIEADEVVKLTADFTLVDTDGKHAITYAWSTGQTTQSIDYSSSVGGTFDVSCTATVTPSNELLTAYELTDSQQVVVKEAPVDPGEEVEDPLNRPFYFHPLPERNQASSAIPYWVLDEINYALANGIDWSKPKANGLKYDKGIQSIVDAINAYDSVLLRGSRNGRTFEVTSFDLPGPIPTR